MNCSPDYFQHKTISAELSLICFLRAYDGIRETIRNCPFDLHYAKLSRILLRNDKIHVGVLLHLFNLFFKLYFTENVDP